MQTLITGQHTILFLKDAVNTSLKFMPVQTFQNKICQSLGAIQKIPDNLFGGGG
jgi:hypothetical protein